LAMLSSPGVSCRAQPARFSSTYIHMHTHTYIHIYMDIHTYMDMQTHIDISMHTCNIHTHTYTHTHILHAHMHTDTHSTFEFSTVDALAAQPVLAHLCGVCVRECVCVCVVQPNVNTYTHTHIHKHLSYGVKTIARAPCGLVASKPIVV